MDDRQAVDQLQQAAGYALVGILTLTRYEKGLEGQIKEGAGEIFFSVAVCTRVRQLIDLSVDTFISVHNRSIKT
jgi:hypothetical protein